jgi:hypothetical protein
LVVPFAAFRLLLLMGAVSVSDIVTWADGVIVAEDQPPEWLLDVSLAANDSADKVESRLRDLPCEGNKLAASYSAIEFFAQDFTSGKISALLAAHMLKVWAANARVNQDGWTGAMVPSWIADEISYGYTSVDAVVSAIHGFLEDVKTIRKTE